MSAGALFTSCLPSDVGPGLSGSGCRLHATGCGCAATRCSRTPRAASCQGQDATCSRHRASSRTHLVTARGRLAAIEFMRRVGGHVLLLARLALHHVQRRLLRAWGRVLPSGFESGLSGSGCGLRGTGCGCLLQAAARQPSARTYPSSAADCRSSRAPRQAPARGRGPSAAGDWLRIHGLRTRVLGIGLLVLRADIRVPGDGLRFAGVDIRRPATGFVSMWRSGSG